MSNITTVIFELLPILFLLWLCEILPRIVGEDNLLFGMRSGAFGGQITRYALTIYVIHLIGNMFTQ